MIRRATPEDAAAIVRLAAQLGGTVELERMPARLQRILDQPTHAVFVADDEHGACGFAAAEHRTTLESAEAVELTALVVDEAARRKGFGALLVSAVEAWAMRRGVDRVQVRSNIVREQAHVFYPGLGYALLKTQHVYVKTTAR
jgi:GNAT superfamily N-acetyltransferase